MSREKTVILAANPVSSRNYLFALRNLIPLVLLFLLALHTNGLAQSDSTKIVVLGDSLVAGYGLAPGEAFPEQLQILADREDLNVTIENAGVSGDTTSGGLARLDWSVGEDTDIVLIELGANDALRGISSEVTRDNLEKIIKHLTKRDIKVMLIGMLAPPNMGEDYEKNFNAIYRELADRYSLPLYPFFLDGVAANPKLNQPDGMHPTAKGVKIITERFLPFFRSGLAELKAS